MEPLNLPLMQIQYEVLHDSIESIAEEHNISQRMVEYAVNQNGWEQKALSTSEKSDAITAANTDRQVALEAIHTLRQGILDPHYIKVEAALVAKAIEVIKGILPTEPTAAKRLRELTDILATLRPTKSMQKSEQNDGSIKLMIMNHVGDINQTAKKAEEVEVIVNAAN